MKKHCIIILMSLFTFSLCSKAQTTATNFTEDDCNGVSHTLYDELDAGKIIVLAWVMPCGSCAYFGSRAYDAVGSFSESHPDKVQFFLVDDYANTNCSNLSSWGNNNAMENHTAFSSSTISMEDYGEDGMPKVVVLAGNTHQILYNKNNGAISEQGVKNAINAALTLAVMETEETQKSSTSFPNPSKGLTTIQFYLDENTNATLEVFTVLGEKVSSLKLNQYTPNTNTTVDLDLSKQAKGTYLIHLNTGKRSETTILNLD